MRTSLVIIVVGVATVVGLFAVQFRSLNRLQTNLAALEAELRATPDETRRTLPPVPRGRERVVVQGSTAGLELRMERLEAALNKLAEASEYLMERGTLPLEGAKLAEMINRLLDPSLPDNERLAALRLLRRNGAMSDEVLQGALGWLQTSTEARTRREVLQQLDGITNAIVKMPLLNLATTDPNSDVREEAMENLRRFVSDPQVEQKLWDALRNESDPEVREEAEQALREGPVDAARKASLRNRIFDPNSTLDERITAMQALERADDLPSDVLVSMAELAHNTQDPGARARVFSAFDGSEDPVLKVPLVYGLQDPNPRVREEAADSLSGFRNDPAVAEWLKYVAENDENARVRREARNALGNDRR